MTCQREAPAVAEAQERYGDQVVFVGVAGRADVADIDGFIADRELAAFDHAIDDTGDLWRSFGVTTQPAFAFIDDDGTVETLIGSLGEAGLADKLDALITK